MIHKQRGALKIYSLLVITLVDHQQAIHPQPNKCTNLCRSSCAPGDQLEIILQEQQELLSVGCAPFFGDPGGSPAHSGGWWFAQSLEIQFSMTQTGGNTSDFCRKIEDGKN